jgi:FAD/FMN-containing dehydrogenase
MDPKVVKARLLELLGADGVLTVSTDVEPYLTDHRRLYRGRTPAVVMPRTVEQVSRVLAFCHEHLVGVVPHGGNTSYCGGATPDETGEQIVLSLRRLNRIRSVDPLNWSMVAEAGCILAEVQRAADAVERFFPLSLGAEGSCQIGGNLSTNAGGTNVVRYGMMRDQVLGIEAVLADGRVLSTLSTLRKDNTGYDIKSLFLGAEGTLGVITAASLKLFPKMDTLDAVLEGVLSGAMERKIVLDAAISQNEREREAFWKLRETIPEAQRLDGASLKHDVSLPIVVLPEFVERAAAWVAEHVPEGRLVAYGHVGDGNLHFNLNQAPGVDPDAFLAREPEMKRAIHDLVREMGGSFSAEHGIGRLKVEELERYAVPAELELMRAVKRAFDPNGILNPGKLFRAGTV